MKHSVIIYIFLKAKKYFKIRTKRVFRKYSLSFLSCYYSSLYILSKPINPSVVVCVLYKKPYCSWKFNRSILKVFKINENEKGIYEKNKTNLCCDGNSKASGWIVTILSLLSHNTRDNLTFFISISCSGKIRNGI